MLANSCSTSVSTLYESESLVCANASDSYGLILLHDDTAYAFIMCAGISFHKKLITEGSVKI